MGISASTTGLDKLSFNPKSLMDEVQDALEESLTEGENGLREIVQTSGTGNKWTRPGPSGRDGSYPGRVDSGDMLKAVDSEISDRGDNYVEGWVGWAEDAPEYTRYQENGFRHVLAGRDVPGMMALRDVGEEVEAILDQKLRRIL